MNANGLLLLEKLQRRKKRNEEGQMIDGVSGEW